jgi:hypothetical protein
MPAIFVKPAGSSAAVTGHGRTGRRGQGGGGIVLGVDGCIIVVTRSEYTLISAVDHSKVNKKEGFIDWHYEYTLTSTVDL